MVLSRHLRALLVLSLAALPEPGLLASTASVQSRLDALQAAREPVVAHVVVALCDNENQGIVPVQASLGNGQDPRSNLYWGALYGVRTHLMRSGYRLVQHTSEAPEGVLERIVLSTSVTRSGQPLELLVVADAWDGRRIADSIQFFLSLASGRNVEAVPLASGSSIQAGGAAAVVAFVGHNGLMDFQLSSAPRAAADASARASIVLACASKPYFLEILEQGGSHPLLLTTGLMAPEAYTLDAAVRTLLEGGSSADIHESAAQAYNAYQRCGIRGARGLFHVAERVNDFGTLSFGI